MTRNEAVHLITQTLNQPFEEQRFRHFAKNLLNGLDETKAFAYHGQYIPDAYKDHVGQYKRLGTYTDLEGQALDVLVVHLQHDTTLERARTTQRNFVAHYLKTRGEKDAALVAYHADGSADWRFSLVRMEYTTQQTEAGKIKVKEELTPVRRYSFLVGKNEPNHTAQQQLVPLLEHEFQHPTLKRLEQAFQIESVTQEFFENYKSLFLNLQETLDTLLEQQPLLKKEFQRQTIDTTNFAKKLLDKSCSFIFCKKKVGSALPLTTPGVVVLKISCAACFKERSFRIRTFSTTRWNPCFTKP